MEQILADALAAFRVGQAARVVQFHVDGQWGSAFRLPVATESTMAAIGDQYQFSGASGIRIMSRARLRQGAAVHDVMIVTTLPAGAQQVLDLSDGSSITAQFLRDHAISNLEKRLGVALDGSDAA